MTKPMIYLVDDEVEILNALHRVLNTVDAEIKTFTSPSEALKAFDTQIPDIVISDQRMPFMSGLDFLTKVSTHYPKCNRIMLSAFQDFETVIDGFNQGVIHNFLCKPWNNRELKSVILSRLASNNSSPKSNDLFVGDHASMLKLKSDIRQVAGANVPIFILGETGSGKELVAKSCHLLSHRSNEPYIAYNCANLSEFLMESQLFGHKKGAFTGADKDFTGLFEQAGKGSVFLDEITTLPLTLQAKLLRVIQEREFTPLGGQKVIPLEAQILSASSTSLKEATTNGSFRSDLYYRLGVIKLAIPPLRMRCEDIITLSSHFMSLFNEQYNKSFVGYDLEAKLFVNSYQWPGNVRQLENALHQISILFDESLITLDMLKQALEVEPEHSPLNNPRHVNESFDSDSINISSVNEIESLEAVERAAIEKAIFLHNGNISKAAAALDINPSTIYRKMSKWDQ